MINVEIIFLGTGVTVSKRAGASVFIKTDRNMIFDLGPRSLWNMETAKIDRNSIDNIFITHLHADHYSDFLIFYFEATAFGRTGSLNVYGPEGCAKVLNAIRAFPVNETAKFETGINEVAGGKIRLGKTIITAQKVKHDPDLTALAYRIEYNGRTAVYSGDSTRCPELIELCRNADVAILEASHIKPHGKHMTPHEAADVAEKAGVKKLVLTHLYPDSDTADIVKMAKEKFSGEVIKAEDLMCLDA